MERRDFFKTTATLGIGAFGLTTLAPREAHSTESDINLIGPKAGYSPHIGTLVSMLTWMRETVLHSVAKLTQPQLDFLFDANANTIGAMLMHLAATETYYGMHTFEGKEWGKWPDEVKKRWDSAMELGDAGRRDIKGNNIDYYLKVLKESREHTLAELKKRDDKWLLSADKFFGTPTNNYCKWFHVCEHESNHNGQIKFLASRLPGAAKAHE